MWSYIENNPGWPGDGYLLISPVNREVCLIPVKVDAEEIVAMLNEALIARTNKK